MSSEQQTSIGLGSEASVKSTPEHIERSRAWRIWLSAALAIAVAAAFAAGRLSTTRPAERAARQSASMTLVAQAESVTPVPPANRITYFLVGSQEQADTVRQVLREQTEQANAADAQVAPFDIVVLETPEEQQAFEEDINECQALPDCIARLGNPIDLRPYR